MRVLGGRLALDTSRLMESGRVARLLEPAARARRARSGIHTLGDLRLRGFSLGVLRVGLPIQIGSGGEHERGGDVTGGRGSALQEPVSL